VNDDEFNTLCEAHSFGAVARGEFPLMPRGLLKALVDAAVAAERKRWQRIATNAQAVTNGGEDKLDYFEVPSHLMAALALALDEGPN
jgi:hypothetical protein